MSLVIGFYTSKILAQETLDVQTGSTTTGTRVRPRGPPGVEHVRGLPVAMWLVSGAGRMPDVWTIRIHKTCGGSHGQSINGQDPAVPHRVRQRTLNRTICGMLIMLIPGRQYGFNGL